MCAWLLQDRASWAPKFSALRLAHPLVAFFSKPLEGVMPALMGATWQLLLAAQVRNIVLQVCCCCCCCCFHCTSLYSTSAALCLLRSPTSSLQVNLLLRLLPLLFCCSRCTSTLEEGKALLLVMLVMLLLLLFCLFHLPHQLAASEPAAAAVVLTQPLHQSILVEGKLLLLPLLLFVCCN
jgi:hypothetical protein